MAGRFAPIGQYTPYIIASIVTLGAGCLLSRLFTTPATKNNRVDSLPRLKGAEKCRFCLDTSSSHRFVLSDGRNLGYAEYGSPNGKAIFYLHGLPGSRLEAAAYHDLGLELGARIIGVDRPGMGWSSPHASRTLLDFPSDLEELAKHLEVSEYAVMGVSGGGPYALACGVSTFPILRCISIVCGLGPMDIGMRGADIGHKLGFPYGWRYTPTFLLRWRFARDPVIGHLHLSDEQRLQRLWTPSFFTSVKNEKDRAIMKDEDTLRLALGAQREAQAQGFEGVKLDGRLLCLDWGFRVEDVRKDVPVQLWYGKEDVFVPLRHGEEIARRLGGAPMARLRVEEETHWSISAKWKREQIEGILGVM